MSTEEPLEGEFVPKPIYKKRSNEEILEIAKGIYKNEVFTSMQIEEQDSGLILSIFMPLAFLDPLSRKQLLIDKITNFYAYTKEAGPRAINGYPCFFSVNFLDQQDSERVIKKYKEILSVMGENNG